MNNEGGDPGAPGLQFDKAEFDTPQGTHHCQRCQRMVTDEYFDVGGQMFCRPCTEEVGGIRGSRGAFLRAFGYGAGAALVGTVIWFAIIKLFSLELGIIAIAVGWLVGLAVRKGSRGRGGWKYQTLAMVLTYMSITASYVPMVIEGIAASSQAEQEEAAPGDGDTAGNAPADETAAMAATPPAAETPPPSSLALLLFFAIVFAVAFAAPFLAGFENIMGLIIIAIALYEAWKLNRRVVVAGPFRLAPAESEPQAVAGAG